MKKNLKKILPIAAVLLLTIPFVYMESGRTTAFMVFIIYSFQIFQFWAFTETTDLNYQLMKNQHEFVVFLNDLSEELENLKHEINHFRFGNSSNRKG